MAACEEYLELISRYVDNDLSGDESEQLFEHLAHCAGCSDALSSFEELRIMAKENLKSPPSELRSGVMESIKATKNRPWYVRWRFTAVAAIFALVILALSATPLGEVFAPPSESQVLVASESADRSAPPAAFSASESDASVVEDNAKAMPKASATNDLAAQLEAAEEAARGAAPPVTPYGREFAQYLTFTAAEAPEVLYPITSDRTEQNVIYYIVSDAQFSAVQSALLEDGVELSVFPGNAQESESLIILTVQE